jgi:hypothetical protein
MSQTLADPAARAADCWVEAPVTYLADLSVKPVTYNPPQGTGAPRRDGNYRRFAVKIHDARVLGDALSLDRHGFSLVRHDTAVTDFYDDAQITATYHAEMERLIKQATGAQKVVVFDHTIRVADRAVERGLRAPVPTVHNDYTEKSGPQRVCELLGAEAEPLLTRRFAEYNVWRPIRGPVKTYPLGLVDSSSIAPEDFAITDLVYEDRVGEIYQGVFNPAHRWYYFPEMQRDEAVLIKCYDSMRDGRARFSLHAAFEDPTSPADAPPRESIEILTFAFF